MVAHRAVRSILATMLLVFAAMSQAGGWDPRKSASASGVVASGEVLRTIDDFLREDPSLKPFFDKAYGFAVFPSVGKGGVGIGGAFGKGEVFEQGKAIGRAKLKQISIGLQLGGQKYSEIIFFENRAALSRFTRGGFEFSAQASAVAVTAGASADAAYSKSVAVFTLVRGGLMYEASVGGQKFSFESH